MLEARLSQAAGEKPDVHELYWLGSSEEIARRDQGIGFGL